jgi:predicted alpha/beta-hydrolase family hydrolase
MLSAEQFFLPSLTPPVRGYLHRPTGEPAGSLVLAHGAGSDARSPVLLAAADAFAAAGFLVLRCDLPFRQARTTGPPRPGDAALDREGLRNAALAVREIAPGPVFFGGHSYGGRQASMLTADDPSVAAGLLLLSYPLHPPRRPAELRTAHFPRVHVPALFVHGARDPFGSPQEMEAALTLIPAPTRLLLLPGGHHLPTFSRAAPETVAAFAAITAR